MGKKKILVIHGPNINLIGERESTTFGKESFESINKAIMNYAAQLNMSCSIHQFNSEGEIIDKIQQCRHDYDGIILNAGAYAYYSYAIREAIICVHIPCIEVHFTNYGITNHAEEVRRPSILASVCAGQISGFGKYSYFLALEGLLHLV